MGSYPEYYNSNAAKRASGTYWVTCQDAKIAAINDCNGGVGHNGSADTVITKRIVIRANVSGAISIGGGSSDAFTWH